MEKLTQKFGLYTVATLAFITVLFINIQENTEGEWTIGVPSSIAQTGGENGNGENCLHIYESISEGVGIMPMQCCLTRYDFVHEYYECYLGDCGENTGYCPQFVTKVTTYYEGINCCAE